MRKIHFVVSLSIVASLFSAIVGVLWLSHYRQDTRIKTLRYNTISYLKSVNIPPPALAGPDYYTLNWNDGSWIVLHYDEDRHGSPIGAFFLLNDSGNIYEAKDYLLSGSEGMWGKYDRVTSATQFLDDISKCGGRILLVAQHDVLR